MNKIKQAIIQDYLRERDWEGLLSWAENEKGTLRILTSLLLSDEELIRWRAVEGLGKLVGRQDQKKRMTKVSGFINRMLWNMNDESGGLIRNAPEVITEILINVPKLIDQFGPILASHHDLEPFPLGVYYGIVRLSAIQPEAFLDYVPVLMDNLGSDDPVIRAFSAAALGNMRVTEAELLLNELLNDQTEFETYDTTKGEFQSTKVAALVQAALDKLNEA
jgi:HEAT repeat protein